MVDDLKSARISLDGLPEKSVEDMALDDAIRERLNPHPWLPADMLGSNIECLIRDGDKKKLDEWLTEVAVAEAMRMKVEGSPLTAVGPDIEPDVMVEYLDGFVTSAKHVGGSQVSVSMAFRNKRRWLVNPRSGGWICLDLEWFI